MLYLGYRNFLLKIISQYIFDPENRQEILHEIWIKVYRNLDKYDRNRKFSIWLSVITINTCKTWLKGNINTRGNAADEENKKDSHMKKNRGIQYIDDLAPDVAMKLISSEFEEELCNKHFMADAFSKIENKTHMLAWKLKYINDLSLDEISTVIGKPQSTVKNWIYRVTKKLDKTITKMQQ